MDRDELIDFLTEEFAEDPDNRRLNRILEAADEYAESEKAQEGTTSDTISRQAAIEALERHVKDCNPDHFAGHQKFIEYMDNAEIGSFGSWQFANGFNMGLTAAEVAIEQLPPAVPELDTNLQPICNKSATTEYRKSYYEAIMALDLFTKLFCRNDGGRDLVFRCGECLFEETDGRCLVKQMKQKFCPDYKDFGSMGNL